MNRTSFRFTTWGLIPVLVLGLALGGCNASKGEKGAGIGALAGALIGAGVGYAIDDSAEGAIIGGLAGAMAGGIIGYVVGDRMEDRDETIENNPEIREELAQPGVEEVLDIRRLRISPDQLAPGSQMEVNVIHSYVGPVDRVQPFDVEVTLVDSAGRVLMNETQTMEYENGTYSSRITLEIPATLPPGTYGIDVSMHTGNVTDNSSGAVRVI